MADDLVGRFLKIRTLTDLASFLKITPKTLCFFAFSGASFYRTFEIPKNDGSGSRKISAPVPKLKHIQRDLNEVLEQIYATPSCVHGFVPERSIVSNAAKHVGKQFVVRIDLKDFFPSISGGRIRCLLQSQPFHFPDKVADALTNIVCYKKRLPQGAPTSPALSNMICRKMDYFISRYVRECGVRYTRYADDLTFSSTRKSSLRFIIAENSQGLEVNETLRSIIEDNGFEINHRKTSVQEKGSRQTVTGVVVNQKCNFKRSEYRMLRAMFHNWSKYGIAVAIEKYLEGSPQLVSRCLDTQGDISEERFKSHIKGRLHYYSMIAKGNNRPSIPLQRLWSYYFELANEPVPLALPIYSVYQTAADYTYPDRRGESRLFMAEGTAFLLDGDRLISAAHCISSNEVGSLSRVEEIRVSRDEIFERIDISRFLTNHVYDTALLKGFPNGNQYPAFRSDAKYRPQIGETVIAYGYAYENQRNGNKRLFRTIRAEISELLFDGVYRVNRPFIQGMSGGPVLNMRGDVIGVITQGCKSGDYDLDGGFVSIMYAINELDF